MRKIILLVSAIALMAACKSPQQKLKEKIQTAEQSYMNDSIADKQKAADLITLYREHVDKYPNDTANARFIFKTAELQQQTGHFVNAVGALKEFNSKFPDHRRAPSALFMQAFIYETELYKKDSAKVLYREFLEKYPTHDLAPSAKATLDQLELGLTDEELVRLFESRLDTVKNK